MPNKISICLVLAVMLTAPAAVPAAERSESPNPKSAGRTTPLESSTEYRMTESVAPLPWDPSGLDKTPELASVTSTTASAAGFGYRDVISSGATSGSSGSVNLTATLGQPIVGGQAVAGAGLQQGFWLDAALLALVTCCTGRVGDADGSGQDEPTISDIAAIVDHMFISEAPLWCYGEADTNRSGPREATSADISIGDITVLIDYLFVNGPENFTLADCP